MCNASILFPLVNPRRACAARVKVVVLDVCLLLLISTLAKLYMQITVLTYVAENEDQNKRVIFSKLASLLSLSDKWLTKVSAILQHILVAYALQHVPHDRKNACHRAWRTRGVRARVCQLLAIVSVFCLQSSIYFPLHFVNACALSKPRARATALAFVVPQNCFCMIWQFMYTYIAWSLKGNMTFLARLHPNISAEGLHFSAFSCYITVRNLLRDR